METPVQQQTTQQRLDEVNESIEWYKEQGICISDWQLDEKEYLEKVLDKLLGELT